LKGRLFIEEQRAIIRSGTFLGRLKTNWPLFSGIVGIVVGWSLGLLTPLAQQRLHETAPNRSTTQKAANPVKALPTPFSSVSPP
jgi:hypothetical protein